MNETVKSLRRSPYQTAGIFFALAFSFLVLLIFSFSILLLTRIVHYIETQPQVTIYFLKTTPESSMYKLREELMSTEKVKEVRYISKQEALKIYKDMNKNEPLLLEMVSSEALPASLEVYTQKPEYLKDVAELVKKEPGVEEVAYQQDVIDSLIKVTNSVRVAAMAFLSAQFLVVFFIIFTTITFKIVAKKEEIEIMRLLGASRYFIIRPLLKQNLFINFLASIVSSVIFIGGYLSLQTKLAGFLTGIPSLTLYESDVFNLYIWPPNLYMFTFFTIITFAVGYSIIWFTTFLAASKYIK